MMGAVMNQNNNNSNTNNNMNEHGDAQRRGGAQASPWPRWYDQSQPEEPDESIVATQLDEIVVALGDERGSPSKTSGTPQKTGIFPIQSQRPSELVGFSGKLSVTYGNRKGDRDPAVNADKDLERAEACGYHTMISQGIEGEQQAKEVPYLIGGEGESVVVLREQILNYCFRELEAGINRLGRLRGSDQVVPVPIRS